MWLNSTTPDPAQLFERELPQSTKIYDRTGQTLLYEIFSEQKRTVIPYNELPRNLIFATIVSEDREFFTHKGFSIRGIVRALFLDITRGKFSQGGSTITQQFIKNAFLTPEKSFKRKIRELLLAYQIEQKFSKEEILQLYFNEIPYGSNAYGVEAASQIYFMKSARDLTLDEVAMLAALPQAPSRLSPYGTHADELRSRQQRILNDMRREGYITEEQLQLALQEDFLKKIRARSEKIIAPHFVFYVKDLLEARYGPRAIERGGFKIITTLDLEKQKLAEDIIARRSEENQNKYNASNAALVSMDVKTGQILAMVGSKDFFDEKIDGQVNVATRPRQPGSSFKPIVYAAAFEKGYTPDTMLFDVETNFGPQGATKKDYIPHNYTGKEYGLVSMRQALGGSLNIASVKTVYLTGVDNALSLAERMGYSTFENRSRFGLSLVLGGGEVKLLEHTAAFSIFAREGSMLSVTPILRVENVNGNALEEWREEIPLQVLSVETSRKINDILSDNKARSFIFGTSSTLQIPGRTVAAKTGTTQDYRDAWTIGYTPQIATGVWVGNNGNQEMKGKADGSAVATPIWREFMLEALKEYPPEEFAKPIKEMSDIPYMTGALPPTEETIVKIDKISGKLATNLTPVETVEERVVKHYKTILQYVDRINPRTASSDPNSDPQYRRWQEGIDKWIIDQKKSLENIGIDDVHTAENIPQIEIEGIIGGTAVIREEFPNFKINIKSKFPIERVLCYLEEAVIIEDTDAPYNCPLNASGKQGTYYLRVVAYDAVKNKAETQKVIEIEYGDNPTPRVVWHEPSKDISLTKNYFPYTLSASFPAFVYKNVKFYIQRTDGENTEPILLGTIFNPRTLEMKMEWPIAERGKYKVYTQGESIGGEVYTSGERIVEVR